jgi:hypothetical protein
MPETAEKHKSCSFAGLTHELWRQRIVLSVICPLPSVAFVHRDFRKWEVAKYNGGDSGIKISVFYCRCSLIRVFIIRGCTYGMKTSDLEGQMCSCKDAYWCSSSIHFEL